MPFGDPSSPFFSYVDRPTGMRLVCHMGRPTPGRPIRFEAFPADGIDIDESGPGEWDPISGTLSLDGTASGMAADVDVLGRWIVLGADATARVESDGDAQVAEGETLITERFLDGVPAGGRRAVLAAATAAADDGAGPDDDLDAIGVNSAGLGHR